MATSLTPSDRIAPLYLSHGGGPAFFMGDSDGPFAEMGPKSDVVRFYKNLANSISPRPTAILVVSAHWEENPIKVYDRVDNELFYDYYGFPDEMYQLKYPAPGSPALAARVVELLSAASIRVEREAKRGLDHGSFIPLKLVYPDADIPVVQLSLHSSLDPDLHVRMGAALEPLTREGVLIVGSGQATHNMMAIRQGFGRGNGSVDRQMKDFDDWLNVALAQTSGQERVDLLKAWAKAPGGRAAHPREEHLIPALVAAGAAGEGQGERLFSGFILGCMSLASFRL